MQHVGSIHSIYPSSQHLLWIKREKTPDCGIINSRRCCCRCGDFSCCSRRAATLHYYGRIMSGLGRPDERRIESQKAFHGVCKHPRWHDLQAHTHTRRSFPISNRLLFLRKAYTARKISRKIVLSSVLTDKRKQAQLGLVEAIWRQSLPHLLNCWIVDGIVHSSLHVLRCHPLPLTPLSTVKRLCFNPAIRSLGERAYKRPPAVVTSRWSDHDPGGAALFEASFNQGWKFSKEG